jgi:hypothetical protein
MPTTSSTITRTDSKSGRFYAIPAADGTTTRMPSVTTILSAIAKPALVGWAAKEERMAVSEAAADLYADLATHPQLPRSMYTLALEQRLGTTKAHVKALAKASDIGTATHAKIEWVLKTQLLGVAAGPGPVLSEGAQRAFLAFEEWARTVRLRPQLIEQTVFSRTHVFAGTMDLLATLDSAALLTLLERQGAVDAALADWLRARAEVTALIDFKTGKSVYAESLLQSCAYQRALAEMGHGRVDGGLIVRLPKVASDPGFEVAVVPPARELFPTFLAVRQLWQWQFAQDEAWRARSKRAVA